MPKASSNAPAPPDSNDALSFEEALTKLESTVASMESGDLPLEDLLSRYEEGARLVRSCRQKLDAAELKIKTLEGAESGELTLSPADAETDE